MTKTFRMPSSSKAQVINDDSSSDYDGLQVNADGRLEMIADYETFHLENVLKMKNGSADEVTPEGEQELEDFESYNGKKDSDHLYWVPYELMLYALKTQPGLRLLFNETFVKFKNKAPSPAVP